MYQHESNKKRSIDATEVALDSNTEGGPHLVKLLADVDQLLLKEDPGIAIGKTRGSSWAAQGWK